MKAEIIAVGSEMLTPDKCDTNSLYLAGKLNEAGYEVRFKSIVGDDAEDIEMLIRTALSRSRVILVTGGLGPTEDDVTRIAAARALGRNLHLDEELLSALRQKFAARAYTMAKNNERQAEIIEGAVTLRNRVGTAPGMWIEDRNAGLALLPGPPRELFPMFEAELMPRLLSSSTGRRLAKSIVQIEGIGESLVDSRAAPIYKQYERVKTTILAARGYIELLLQQWLGPDETSAELEELTGKILSEFGKAVFSTTGESIEEMVGDLLRRSGLTLAVAESCTSGMVGMQITRVPGSSDYFLGGVLCYSNKVKTDICRVPLQVIEEHGAVSAETAEALARGVRGLLKSDIGLSLTGIAGPGGGSKEKPVGLVYVGVSDGSCSSHERRILPGDREMVRERATFFALSLLRRFLLHEDSGRQP